MVKFPQLNHVKGRLAQAVSPTIATELYQNFVLDTLNTFKGISLPFFIAYHPPEAISRFKEWLGSNLEYFPQQGKNLGERLRNGFTYVFQKGYQKVISIASDCPDLPADIILQAVKHLETHDTVLGPSPDGGYYLIGFQAERYFPEVFDGITWSTSTVFEETISKLHHHKNRIHQLPSWLDIDTITDLELFFEKNHSNLRRAPNTMSYLRENPNILTKKNSSPQ
ncbi:MAG: TIGR04282 family arsenosugar biosynthesis glycosyltransferase [Candidatus Ranarchaeia archaeon]|jgi:rSAM/selenodomain-associated transferase 1